MDVLVQTIVQSIEQDEVPSYANPGELYVIGPNPQGEFTSHQMEIAQKLEHGWRFIEPIKWMRVTLNTDGSSYRFDDQRWELMGN